ncbi:MAG: carboxymuconolactone decarboxylase family protein [Gammaproteobacteria bacterium]|nr:carboxymuconolactone decarboxylase family protein [Gammaproteobacteria bacterium]
MARIPLVEADQAGPEVRAVYERMQGLGFSLFNVFKLFGNDARLLRGFSEIAMALYENPKISPRHRELAYLRASQLNSCHY